MCQIIIQNNYWWIVREEEALVLKNNEEYKGSKSSVSFVLHLNNLLLVSKIMISIASLNNFLSRIFILFQSNSCETSIFRDYGALCHIPIYIILMLVNFCFERSACLT